MTKFEDFIQAGYTEYNTHKGNRMCQKTIKEDNNKLFFINIFEWDFREHNEDISLVAEVELYQEMPTFAINDIPGRWFSVHLHNCEHRDIENIEHFFMQIYKRMECVPDIHNN